MKAERIAIILPIILSAACLLTLPSVLANQWHKLARAMFFDPGAGFRLDHAHQTLRLAGFADRNYQTATNLQLRDQRFGNFRPTCVTQNSIIRTVSAPAERTVKSLDRRIVNPEGANAGLRFARQLADPFYRLSLGRKLRQDRGLIA